jgi:nicotinamidase-related amidase
MAENTALLVVDVQVDMFNEQDPVYEGARLLDRIGSLIAKARVAGVPVVYVQHNEQLPGTLVKGEPGWPIHPAIAPQAGDRVIQKHHPDSFQETDLQQVLEAGGIRKLVITGIQSDVCVDTTIRRAYSLNYDVTLVGDAHSTWASPHVPVDQLIAHQNFRLRSFAAVVTADEVRF